jgi:hypothetical protein
MNAPKHFRIYLLLCSLVVALQALQGFAQSSRDASRTNLQETLKERDGQHDFDFEIGTWKTHISRLVVRKIWNGRANLVELEADGPTGHLQVLSLRLYNPQSRQWSLHAANSSSGTLSVPTIGEFKNGRGEFFDQEPFNGRTILVRNVWSDITPNSCRFEQAFSDDGGKTWEVNWVATDTRMSSAPG